MLRRVLQGEAMTEMRDAIEELIEDAWDTDPKLGRWLMDSIETFDKEQALRKEIAAGDDL